MTGMPTVTTVRTMLICRPLCVATHVRITVTWHCAVALGPALPGHVGTTTHLVLPPIREAVTIQLLWVGLPPTLGIDFFSQTPTCRCAAGAVGVASLAHYDVYACATIFAQTLLHNTA